MTPEKPVLKPPVPQLLLNKDQPGAGILGRPVNNCLVVRKSEQKTCAYKTVRSPYTSRRLEADDEARPLVVISDRPAHDQPHRQRRVDALLPGRGLDEVGARHHTRKRRPLIF